MAQILLHITNQVTTMNLVDLLRKEGVGDLFLVVEI